ncbi:MAG TPA: hypothetical protein VNA69_21360 [Thermoanaerobaculia bacterium]|nr:hypothetical protein [Thermoanaerobaculia bacterium]
MKRAAAIAILIVALNIVAAFVGRGSFLHVMIALMLLMYVVVPATVLALLAMVVARWRPALHAVARWLFVVALVAGSFLLSVPPGILLLRRDIAAAKSYCDALVPRLEEHRRMHGAYPEKIGAVSNAADRPRLLVRDTFYMSNGVEFLFSFDNPGGMFNGFSFASTDGRWEEWD